MRLSRRITLNCTGIFHKMWHGHNREYVLKAHIDKIEYLKALSVHFKDEFKEQLKWHSYCLMGTHPHETGTVKPDENNDLETGIQKLGNWMRNAHSQFGAAYNRRYKRRGKVAYDRPKTSEIENQDGLLRVMFYGDVNPVRAGIVSHPSKYKYSSYRFYAYGEKNEFTDQLTMPACYLALGKTPQQRQKAYRSLCDQYLREKGLLDDAPLEMECRFIGSESWQNDRRVALRKSIKNRDGPQPVPV